jgi:hypothetical protein
VSPPRPPHPVITLIRRSFAPRSQVNLDLNRVDPPFWKTAFILRTFLSQRVHLSVLSCGRIGSLYEVIERDGEAEEEDRVEECCDELEGR